ncbi:MAG TPA: hypothetical protein P5037_02850 [Candidatus Paceibacterota bacterium]|nr:hypothetical protein [Limisphaerales bacterium]HQE88568.1 hypothetical protein [Verrucomicrobiota bacterium]HRY57837.1 hypothetical protein [Candidatus Paceibacterota bacterium]HQH02500.1 hypothetical protein [Verrucomicrobiota bacterium]HQJ49761.1 hypothetical protein [Verrucomicrobiota bacterium]
MNKHPLSRGDAPRPGRTQSTAVSRREWLQGMLSAGSVLALGGCALPRSSSPGSSAGLIRRENQRPGTRDWLLTKTGIDPATQYRCPWIEGYCSHTSIRAGQTLTFHVSTNPPATFTLDLYRLGYYGGAGGRLVKRLGPFQGAQQPDPPIGPRRLRDCQWEACAALKIPADWLSGVYVGKLTAQPAGWQSYVIFIVRDDRRADFLFQCSDTTWQAYNRWPNQFSLYDDGLARWYWGNDVAVSFNRPYGKYCQILDAPLSTGSGEFFLWEFPLAYWLEEQGYDVSYISNLDTHADPAGLLRARGFLSVGHDEYYSLEMFRHLQHAIRQGLNVAFLSGNTCCGRIEFQPDFRGRLRTYERVDFYGPRDPKPIRGMEKLPHTSPSSAELVGARNLGPFSGGADWICLKPEHWLFAGTSMKRGEGIPGLVGWEWHGDPAAIPGLEIVAGGPTQWKPGVLNHGHYTATIYPGPRGNFVFNASTCWWGDGLSEPPGYVRPSVYTQPAGPDSRVQQITRNLLEQMRRPAR